MAVHIRFPAVRWLAYTPIWLLFLAAARWALPGRGVVVDIYVHDLYVVIDSAWRTYLGQVPNVDYGTPVGPAYTWPWLVLRRLEPFSLATIVHAEWLVAFVLLLAATLTLPRRLGPLAFLIVCLALVTAAITPRAMMGQVEGLRRYFNGTTLVAHSPRPELLYSYRIDFISHLAPYNRWCQAALILLIPLLLVAPRTPATGWTRSRDPDSLAALVIGAVLAFLALTKATYALGALPIIAIGLWQGQISRKTVAIAAGVLVALLALEQASGQDLLAYLADVRRAAAATVDFYSYTHNTKYHDFGLKNLGDGAFLFEIYAALTVLVALGHSGRMPWRLALQHHMRGLLLAFLTIALVLAINTQNFTQHEFPALGPILMISTIWFAHDAPAEPASRARRIAMVLALGLGTLVTISYDIRSIAHETLLAQRGQACSLPQWRGTAGEGLLLPASAFDKYREDGEPCTALAAQPASALALDDKESFQVAKLIEARTLLAGHVHPDSRILALDFSNPYPAFTGTQAPRTALLWWDPGRDFSTHVRPDAATLLGSATLVMQTRQQPPRFDLDYDPLWREYGPDVAAQFTPIAETPLWRLWQRRPVPAR